MPDPTDVVVSPVADSFEAYEAIRRGETPVEETAATEPEATTEEASEPSTTEQEESRERDEKGQFKPKKSDVPEGVQKRIDKAIAKQREAERQAEEYRRQLEEVQAKKPAETKTEAKVSEGEPTPDKFETYEQYSKALARWEAKQVIAEEREREATESKKRVEGERSQSVNRAWNASLAAAKEAHPDYDDVIQETAEAIKSGELPGVSDEVYAAILETDSKAEIMYYLAKNRADLERLTSVPANRVMFELGKIEAKLAAPVQENEKKAAVKAPKPPTPVGNRSSSTVSMETAKNFEEYEAARRAKLSRR